MNLTITHAMTQNGMVSEMSPDHFATEASMLCLPVGKFPKQIETEIGNGQPLVLNKWDGREFTYTQSLGCVTLTIFND